jgi:hemerythrin superfamily protein
MLSEFEQEINQLMDKEMVVKTTECLIDFIDLALLVDVAKEQMLFPSWRNSNPDRTQKLQDVLTRYKSIEQERGDRCTEFAKALGELHRRKLEGLSVEQLKAEIKLLKGGLFSNEE